jgi:hypothetical protein
MKAKMEEMKYLSISMRKVSDYRKAESNKNHPRKILNSINRKMSAPSNQRW